MINQDFLDAGYTRFDPPEWEDCITDQFQKCFYDEHGERIYFITVERWDYNSVSPEVKHIPICYNFIVQFRTKEGRTLDLNCFNGFDIESAEKFVADMWNTGWFENI